MTDNADVDLDAINSRLRIFTELNREWLKSLGFRSLFLLLTEDVPALLAAAAEAERQRDEARAALRAIAVDAMTAQSNPYLAEQHRKDRLRDICQRALDAGADGTP